MGNLTGELCYEMYMKNTDPRRDETSERENERESIKNKENKRRMEESRLFD